MYVIAAKNVSKKYISGNHKNILFDKLSFHVQEGEVVFICGNSGSGRTTLLKMLAAMTPPNRGQIEVLGRDLLTIENRSEWRIKHIGFLTNQDCLIPYLTVKQQLLMGQDENDPDFEFFNDEALYILKMLDISDSQLVLYPDHLKKIEKLKITIARSLMSNPRLLLLDDFTKDLTEDERFDLYNTLFPLTTKQNITLIITGELENCPIADRVLKLKDGKLVEVAEKDGDIPIVH